MLYEIILTAVTFLTPLFFLTLTPNYFSTPKLIILFVSCLLILLNLLFMLFRRRSFSNPHSPIVIPLTLFIAVISLNFFLFSEGRLESLTGRGGLYILVALLSLLTLFAGSVKQITDKFLYALIGASSLLAIHSLLQLTWFPTLDGLPSYFAERAFTPTGSPLTTLTLLIIGAAVTFFLSAKQWRNQLQYFGFGLGILQTIAAVAYIALMLPGGALSPALLPYNASWAITLDALKSTRSLLMGIGLANFSLHFTSVKPLFLNATGFWNTVPTTATSELLQLLTTGGVLTLITFLSIPLTALFSYLQKSNHTEFDNRDLSLLIILILSLTAFVFTPMSATTLLTLFLSSILLARATFSHKSLTLFSTMVISGIGVIVVTLAVIFAVRAVTAEYHIGQASRALSAGDGKAVYDHHGRAVSLMPGLASYRYSYSQINLTLASSLSEKPDLTEEDRNQITTLISQAIREAKAAASLRPHDYRMWQNIGSLYRNLINVADGAEEFAISAYKQAIALDPANAALRVEYGGLLYQLSGSAEAAETKNAFLVQAVQEFQTAVQLKQDYANGYYNLSKALETAGNIPTAYAAMQKVIASLDPDSPELEKATSDMEALKAKLPKPSPTPTPNPGTEVDQPAGELSQPEPLPSPLPGGPLDLPSPTPNP